MGSEAFAGSRLRVQWAKECLADFEQCAEGYFEGAPREVFVQPDPDGIREHHKLRFTESFPVALTKHTVHAVEDLRAALDLAACDVARLANIPFDDVHFPFCKLSTDFKSRINSCCKGFPKAITDVFAGYEPYADGSEILFAVNTLCNNSKHKIIVPVASFIGTSISFESSDIVILPVQILEGFSNCENEKTFAITQRGLRWKYEAKFSFGIGFGDVGAISGRDVGANVKAMIEVVEMIVNEIEAKSRDLGFLA